MRTSRLIRIAVVAMGLAAPAPVEAHESVDLSGFDEAQALAHSQAAIGRTVAATGLVDRKERVVDLAQFRGKPLIISMIYTSCYHTCPMITQAVERGVIAARDTFGADGFSVLTIGFDTKKDTPKRMRIYASQRGIDYENWRFLSASNDVVESLSEALGFIYFPSPKGFDHLAQTTIVSGEGVVVAQIYGADFSPPSLVEPIKHLVYGTTASVMSVESVIERIRLFCTIYDPRSDRYRFDYSIFIGLILGGLVLSTIAVILGRNAWRLWGPGRSA